MTERSPWVIVASGFHRKGGQDKADLALAEYLLEKEIAIHLVCHSLDPLLAKHPLVKVCLVPRPARSFLLGGFLLAFWGHIIARRVIEEHGNARVVAHGGNCFWPGINWVHYVHHAWTGPRKGAPLLHQIIGVLSDAWGRIGERIALRRAQLVITNSKRSSQEVTEYFGVDESLVHTVYLGSDSEWGLVSSQERATSRQALNVDDRRTLAVFVGGIGYDRRKGFDVLVHAWAKLCERPDWDVDLLVAGDGPALAMWKTRISQSGLDDRIRLLGFSNQVDRILAAVDLLVSPVRYEAYGLNVQEAICRGIPAMVSVSAGVAERYESDFAAMLIPDPENVDDLVRRLLQWRSKKEEWRARFQPFGDRLRSRSWRDTAVDLVAIVQRKEVSIGEEVYPAVLTNGQPSS